MAGMIEGIFGIMPSDVRAAEIQDQQKAAAELVKKGQASPFAASFGTAFGASLGQGLLSRLGLETPEMAKAKANQQEAQAFVNEYSAADTADKMDVLVSKLIAKDAPLSAINAIQSRADKLREQETPIAPEEVTKSKIDLYTDTMAKAAEELGGIDLTDLPEEDLQSYYRYVMGRVFQQEARIKTANKQGAKQEQPLRDDVIRGIIQSDARSGILSSKDKFFGLLGQEAEFNSPAISQTMFLNTQDNQIYKVQKQEQQ